MAQDELEKRIGRYTCTEAVSPWPPRADQRRRIDERDDRRPCDTVKFTRFCNNILRFLNIVLKSSGFLGLKWIYMEQAALPVIQEVSALHLSFFTSCGTVWLQESAIMVRMHAPGYVCLPEYLKELLSSITDGQDVLTPSLPCAERAFRPQLCRTGAAFQQ